MVNGQCQSLFERYLILAASLIIWLVAGKMYSANCISATGLLPIIAAPIPVPTMLDSANGVDRKSTRLNSSHVPYTTLFRSKRHEFHRQMENEWLMDSANHYLSDISS